MYQITLCVNNQRTAWYDYICGRLGFVSAVGGVYAFDYGRFNNYVTFGCERNSAAEMMGLIEDLITQLFLTVIKEEYMVEKLKPVNLPESSKKLLLRTLVAFDRETESKIIGANIIGNEFCIDGFYNFKMNELKTRWKEVCALAEENVVYLSSDETMNELLRFLIGAVNPKVNKVEIFQYADRYRLVEYKDNYSNEYEFLGFDELMYYLIDVAPSETVLVGGFESGKVYEKLSYIFDARHNFT